MEIVTVQPALFYNVIFPKITMEFCFIMFYTIDMFTYAL